MNFVRGITCLAFILLIFCCKKKDPPESVYMLERDYLSQTSPATPTNTIKPNIIIAVPQASYQPIAADTIVAVFLCSKGRYVSVNGFRGFANLFYYYDAKISLNFDSLGWNGSRKDMDSSMIQFAPGDSNNTTIKYTKGSQTYIMHSTKGYPNCTLDPYYPIMSGSCYCASKNYKIMFNGDPNTDKIYSRRNGNLAINNYEVSLKPYSCSSGKRCSYLIYFENYSYFKINGKWFIWINRITDDAETGI